MRNLQEIDATIYMAKGNFAMLDFASDVPADGLSATPAEQAASNDQALLDAYSNAVIA